LITQRHLSALGDWYELHNQVQEAVPMDDITSNRHAGVIVVSLAILILGLVSTLFGAGQSPLPSAAPSATDVVGTLPKN
jgi:hypothetical protein